MRSSKDETLKKEEKELVKMVEDERDEEGSYTYISSKGS